MSHSFPSVLHLGASRLSHSIVPTVFLPHMACLFTTGLGDAKSPMSQCCTAVQNIVSMSAQQPLMLQSIDL